MKNVVIIAILAALVGCAAPLPHTVHKDGVSQEEAEQDFAYCQMQANQITTADYAYRGTFMEGANIKMKQQEQLKLCAASKGYH